MSSQLPPIPAKRYFNISEVAKLCAVKPHVLRYWEHEFTQLRPMKRRGNRRYYQHHEVLMIRRIRKLLYEQGFTINGARVRLQETTQTSPQGVTQPGATGQDNTISLLDEGLLGTLENCLLNESNRSMHEIERVRRELQDIRNLLDPAAWHSQHTL